MRTNIVIDDALMAAAMEAGGFRTKKDAVEEGLRMLARRAVYQKIRGLRGTLHWDDGTGDRVPASSAYSVQEEMRPFGSPAPAAAKTGPAARTERKVPKP